MVAVATMFDEEPTLEVGLVTATGAELTVRVGRSVRHGRRAASCLLAPGDGDRVLLATTEAGTCFVLAILEAAAPRPMELEGDASIRAASGRLDLTARDGLSLASPTKVAVSASEIDLRSDVGTIAMDRITMLARELFTQLDVGKAVVKRFDGLFERLSQRAERVHRIVSGSDHLRTRQADYSVAETLSIHANNAVVSAQELVKIDGEQIHVG